MQTYSVDHLHLISPNIEETKDWYCKVFGGKVTFEGDFKGKQVYYVDVNGFNIILIEQFPGGRAGTSHHSNQRRPRSFWLCGRRYGRSS